MIATLIVSYLLGSIPTAFLVGKWRGIDIREQGSGNVGATNVFRVMGKKFGTLVLAVDILKGFLVTFWVAASQHPNVSTISLVQSQLAAGLCAIAGHAWPIWLGFRGGKGVATSCGVFLGIYPNAVLLSLLVWVVCALMSRYVSLSSIIAALSFPIFLFLFYRSRTDFALSFVISLLLFSFILYTRRANVKRLVNGAEHKIGEGKKNK